jgi:hypothetical protein
MRNKAGSEPSGEQKRRRSPEAVASQRQSEEEMTLKGIEVEDDTLMRKKAGSHNQANTHPITL